MGAEPGAEAPRAPSPPASSERTRTTTSERGGRCGDGAGSRAGGARGEVHRRARADDGLHRLVRTEIDEDDVTVHIEGDGLGALVGPKGVTIQALQEVVRAVVQHHAGGHSAWIHVDVAGYRERRRQALAEFARQVAAEVKETGEERAMEPMGAADRKVVHDVVADIDGVDTTSEGEEPRRRVVVFPA